LINYDGAQIGIVPLEEARRRAEESELDLVEVAPQATPPVCKIIDFKKILYEQKRKAREARKKQKQIEVKEIKMQPTIDPHDFETKLRHIRDFITHGHKVKVTILYKGRGITHTEIGEQLIEKMITQLADVAEPEGGVRRVGRLHILMLTKRRG